MGVLSSETKGDTPIKERDIQNEIRLAVSPHAIMLRVNSGTFWQGTRVWDARRNQYILTDIRPAAGAPKGTSDLIGIRRDDGKFVAIECKTPRGRLREDQKLFIDAILKSNGIAGIARSAEDALNLLEVFK